MPETIPSMYSVRSLGGDGGGGTLPNGNVRLRYGEVKKEILPTNPESYSKKYREYEVMVQHYEGGSATHRMYHHCVVMNDLCSEGDFTTQSLRESDKVDFQLGNGSRVFILCVEGNDARAIIIGGPQQHNDTSKGVHKETEFNGVNFQVLDDGSWTLENKGKTDNLGKPHKDRNSGAGTTVKVEANGNFLVKTQKCSISVDNTSGGITIESDSQISVKTKEAKVEATSVTVKADSVTIDSSSVGVGANAVEPAVLGTTLVSILGPAFAACVPALITGAQQAAMNTAIARLTTILSTSVRVGS